MKLGMVGWRGMVGSVLLQRMIEEDDFRLFETVFFSTSQAGGSAPAVKGADPVLQDALDFEKLAVCDVIISCQGSEYTELVHPQLRSEGWAGHWIDAASTLRMSDESVIILDPVNQDLIDLAYSEGCLDWIGGNCTVSCMLMGVGALFKNNWVEWMTSQSYQAASGGGALHMRELLVQMGYLHQAAGPNLGNLATNILDIDRNVLGRQRALTSAETEHFGVPLAGSLIPWIDKDLGNGVSREEWKAGAETNKILGRSDLGSGANSLKTIPIDGTCVRVGAMRCHSQPLVIKLTQDIPLREIEAVIRESHPWVEVVSNTRAETIKRLTPVALSGELKVGVGRLRKLNLGPTYLGAFTIGDQLLWGAAEPLRRMAVWLKHQ